ncbi:MAG TPA: cupin domain-containing protein [Polyangiales bacterium]|nr:cupin domain-containing protein [Polyangiales bacterium]
MKGTAMPVITAPVSATHELPGASFTALVGPARGARDTSVWRVELAPGSAPTPHHVTREEVFVILSGRARVTIAGQVSEAGAGDAVLVPARTPFAIACAGETPLTALCCLPIGGQAVLPGGEPFTPPWAQ